MVTKTKVIWDWPLDELTKSQIFNYKLGLVKSGIILADDSIDNNIDPATGQKTVIIEWADENSAQEWLTYVAQFNPVSAVIMSAETP